MSNGCEQLTAATASKALLGSLNDLVLKRFIQVTEVVTVSGYADDQFFVFLWVLLSFNQSLAVDNVELYMMSVHSEVGTNQSSQVVNTLLACDISRRRNNGNHVRSFWEESKMQYFAGTREFQIKEPTAVTIGKFDGLHRGHQKLLREVMRYREKGYKPAVFTFETAPGTLIRGKLQTMITTNEEREENLREAGVEYLVEYPFNQEVAHMDPEQFVAEILVGKMGAKAIVSGPDCHFGYQRKGDAELLRKLAPKYGYEVSIVEKAMDGDREISSTYIREELAKGNIRKANELLGYEYRISGQVVHGEHLGSTLGFPTANILPGIQKHLPAFGVYLSRTVIDGASYGSITNIGKKPTIAGERPAGAETYIYDLDENLYGKKIEVHFLDFMRPEMKFSGVDELKMQVLKDKETGRKMHGAER